MESRSAQTESIVIAFTTLSALVICLRIISRFIILQIRGIEDYLIVVASIFSIATGVLQVNQIHWGVGRHFLSDVTMAEFVISMKFLYASIQTYNIGLTLTKVSILCQYLRLFPVGNVPLVCKVSITVVICYGIECFFTGIFTCVPIEAFWNVTLPGAKCLPKQELWYTNAAINITTDFFLALLPIPVLNTLKVGQRQRYILMGIFGLGLFVCVVSILRLHALIVLESSQDPTWDQAATTCWSSIELNIAIICASLPTLRPVIRRIFPSLLGSTNAYGNSYPRQGSERVGGKRVGGGAVISSDNKSLTLQRSTGRDEIDMYDLEGRRSNLETARQNLSSESKHNLTYSVEERI
ncbi:hypothetical protein TWF225_010567 [Orbilia oligospora]|nr:hypothetical protein TWF225_010567 [Orbilia oligospora]KAF3250999.1 hypothetical protein TWF128_007419 [Orbilia oligospora]KAF3259072.1 hypothetical protein TWF217_005222 [Orbilia oligospora]